MDPIRINKYLAEQGQASRREADRLIATGKVFINGKMAELGSKVVAGDEVEIRDASPKTHYYLAYNKPRNVATEEVRYPNGTFPLGRLDKDSEGLLLATNDGRLTGRILGTGAVSHSTLKSSRPSEDTDDTDGDKEDNKIEKEYVVEVDKKIDGLDLKKMSEGMEIKEGLGRSSWHTKPAKTERVNDTVFKIILTEGKKHQIRRMCAALGYQTRALKRIRVANIRLGKERPGTFRALSPRELTQLLGLLGLEA